MKSEKFDHLLLNLSKCKKCMNLQKKSGEDCSLINIYRDSNFCKNIPSMDRLVS